MVLAGALLALQARVNGSLAHDLGGSSAQAVLTAAVSFAFGTVVLLVVLACTPSARDVVVRWRFQDVRWWYCIGGLGGAALVSTSAAAAPVIGIALLSVCTVAGQTAGSLAVDEVGLSSAGRRPITRWRVVGALIAVVAMAFGAIGRTAGGASPALYVALAGAGVLVAGQQAVNGRLRDATGSAPVAATVSFLGGTLVLGLAVVVLALTGALPTPDWPSEWWLYVGGLGGALYITLGAITVRVLGVLTLTLASVAGQLAGSVVLDLVTPTGNEKLTATTTVSVLLTFVAVVVAARADRSRS